MKLAVIYNSRSGSAMDRAALQEIFDEAKITVSEFIDITKTTPNSLKKLVSKHPIVAAYGGDGTICSVADAVTDTKIVLVPLPGGTLNHFTKDLSIPQDIHEAVQRLKSAKVRKIDIASVNGKAFVNNSSIGIYPSSLRERSKYEKYFGKWPAAVYAGVRAFMRFRVYDVTLDGHTIRTPFIFIGNNVYDSENAMERKRIDQGVLSVFAIRSPRRRTLLKLLALGIINRVNDADEFQSFTTTSLTISARRSKLRVATDGEHQLMKAPLTYTLRPGALRIL